MKLRVIKKKNGKYYSQYYLEGAKSNRWSGTYRTLNSITENEFDTKEEAVVECYRFVKNECEGRIVWEDETKDV